MNTDSQTDRDKLINLAISSNVRLFHSPEKAAFTTFDVAGHRETHPLRGQRFALYLGRLYWEKHKSSLGKHAIEDAIGLLEGKALFEGPEKRVYRRVAFVNGKIFLDLCDKDWRVVEISSEGWNILDEDIPVKFIRSLNAKALPEPKRGGSLEQLRPCINAADEANWILFVSWLLGALQPYGAYAILVLQGEQDSGKSATTRTIRRVIEPTFDEIRRMPQDPRDLMIAATHNHILAFDNLSGASPKMADALCTISTGIGQGARKLYTDSDESILNARRPIMLNGISEIARRPDLLNRSIVLRLPPIKSRKTDRELEQQFEEVWPFVLGALLDAACIGLSNLESVPTESLPRMADFSRWIIACEDALPWDSGTFLDAYRENVQQAAGALLREEPVFIVFERFMKKRKSVDGVFYEGTPTGLLEQLELFENNDENALPKTANWLMKKFERLNPPIRLELGVEIVHDKRTKDQRSVTVRQVERPGSKPTNQTTRGTS